MIGRRVRTALVALASFAGAPLAGCWALRPATVPLRTLRFPGREGSDRLLVLLPGRSDAPEDFNHHGFVAAARAAGVDADIVAVDAHTGYYLRRVIHQRLHEDVIAPEHARGKRRIWLAGISLGALGSVIQGSEFRGDVDGMVLIAPYLGSDDLLEEVERAGGLARWTPHEGRQNFPPIWGWLKGYATAPQERPPLLLAYGERDRYVRGDRLLAAELPAGRVLTAPGGHDWGTWTVLWGRLLQHPVLRAGLEAREAALPAGPP